MSAEQGLYTPPYFRGLILEELTKRGVDFSERAVVLLKAIEQKTKFGR